MLLLIEYALERNVLFVKAVFTSLVNELISP